MEFFCWIPYPHRTMTRSLSFLTSSLLLPIALYAQLSPTTQPLAAGVPEPIPFSELGAKVSDQYKGDAVRVIATAEGAHLHTGFQQLDARVTSEGLALFSLEEERGSLRLVSSAYGRGGTMQQLASAGAITIDDQVVRYTRPNITEEYSVSADGVRQDFVVMERPVGSGELRLHLDLEGAVARSVPEGALLTLAGSGRELAYTRLHVTDARGEEMTASMEVLDEDQLVISVADAMAEYPVRIDPTFSDADWTCINVSGGTPGTDGTVTAMASDGAGKIYIVGGFTRVGITPANGAARWNGSTWSALGAGIGSASPYCMAVSGNNVYIGGFFNMVGSVPASNVARWNGTTWSAMGSGANDAVYAMATIGSTVYAGGFFSSIGGVPAQRIGQWNGSAWSAVGAGVNNSVRAMAASGTNLYVGGYFNTLDGSPGNYVALWNGTTWSGLGTGVNGIINALAVNGSNVYVGGSFTMAAGGAASRVAQWNGSAWSALGSGVNGTVDELAVVGTNVYVTGGFSTAGGNAAAGFARWNGSAWSSMSTNTTVPDCFAVNGTDLYAGVTTAGGLPANGFARWDGAAWSIPGGRGLNAAVSALAISGTDVYAAGYFTTAGGAVSDRIAKWNGSTWSALGTGISGGSVLALAVSGANVYAAGSFTTAGGVPATRIARWNGTTWSALGSGLNDQVNALAISGSTVYAGGFFTTAGGDAALQVAQWNGTTWSALGTGTNNFVWALTMMGTDLIVGGSFSTAGGNTVNNIARWNGAWSALGTGLGGAAKAFTVIGTNLYVGGDFTTAGGASANRVARWNGSAWSALGSGFNASVTSLANDGTKVYAGGYFTTAGATTVNRLAQWNGTAWSAMGTGLDSEVYAVAVSGTNIYVGGQHTLAGTTASPYIVRGDLNGSYRYAGPRVLLEGAYDSGTGLMRDDLRSQGFIPANEPYTALGFTQAAGGGGESVAPAVLAVTGNNAIVDWVRVELRSAANSGTVVATRQALLQRDGDVVATDGTSALPFDVGPGDYYLAVRHRNHNGVMTSNVVTLSGTSTTVDFAGTTLATYGTNAQKTIGAVRTLWMGNSTGNSSITYTGSGNDRDPILIAVGSTTPNSTVNGYYITDTNLNGQVRYTGSGNDRDPILINVGSTTPNNTRLEQLP